MECEIKEEMIARFRQMGLRWYDISVDNYRDLTAEESERAVRHILNGEARGARPDRFYRWPSDSHSSCTRKDQRRKRSRRVMDDVTERPIGTRRSSVERRKGAP